jgi:chaperone BCS1
MVSSAPDSVVYVMTTNDVTALDSALLRPGRIDYKLYLGEACESQKVELYRRFFPEASLADAQVFAQAHWADTMAEFQGLLLTLESESRDPHQVSAPEPALPGAELVSVRTR